MPSYQNLIFDLKDQGINPPNVEYKHYVASWVERFAFHKETLTEEEQKSVEKWATMFQSEARKRWKATNGVLANRSVYVEYCS